MLSEQNLDAIRSLIAAHGGAQAPALTAALRELETAIAGEALLIRSLLIRVRRAQVADAELRELLTHASLSGLFQQLGVAKKNPFSLAEADAAVRELGNRVTSANDFSHILGSVVAVAKVFI